MLDVDHPQLALGIQRPGALTFESYYVGQNDFLIQQLQAVALGQAQHHICLWGRRVGLTHLLHATCDAATVMGRTALLVPLGKYQQLSVRIFEGVETLSLVALDDLQAISGDRVWEEALLHLFQQNTHLILGSKQGFDMLQFTLPELATILQAQQQHQVRPVQEADKRAALACLAQCRGLILNDLVASYLLKFSQEISLLAKILALLDKASMTPQRRLTVPFVKDVIVQAGFSLP